ncbi:MAG: hypothetical protein N2316_04110 [Spirochaetes bacterium]|nr:hypothetical protein [Spirochaetota bacterium]
MLTIQNSSPARTVYLLIFFLNILNISISLHCSSKPIKSFDQEGELREIRYTDKRGNIQIIEFSHNKKQRTLTIEKKNYPQSILEMNMRIRYSPEGRITLIAKKVFSKESAQNEAEYDSFTYSKSGEIVKIETSYKSSYSITKHNTALIISQFKYHSGTLSEIIENGGTYKNIIKPTYSDDEIKSLEFSHFEYHPKKRAFEKTKELIFLFSNEKIRKAIDKTTKKEFSKNDAYRMFIENNVGRALDKLKFGTTIEEFLKNPEKFLISE